ncbi:MAG TPA: DUF2637 domain-containing protein, partial [Rugosimonospora sp.]|nr:DUF2637 domain-containing protein [Rugosimonospora sp.]
RDRPGPMTTLVAGGRGAPVLTAEPEYVAAWVVRAAIGGNLFLGACAFWMSFSALADLADRAGVAAEPWVWPLIVDGLIVVSTVSVLALSPFGRRATWFAWLLLAGGAGVSVLGNGMHALWYGEATVPAAMRVTIAAVPPLVLLASTHLTVELARRARRRPADPAPDAVPAAPPGTALVATAPVESPGQVEARRLRALNWTNRRIAHALGVHPSTVSRWLSRHDEQDEATVPGHEPDGGDSSRS